MAVNSAAAAGGAAAQLCREKQVLEGLCLPHVVACLSSRTVASGVHHFLLKFAAVGSLADDATRSGGWLEEPAIRAYARGLAYLHGRSLVHGDIKARNVVVGGDGHARHMDLGARGPCSFIWCFPYGQQQKLHGGRRRRWGARSRGRPGGRGRA